MPGLLGAGGSGALDGTLQIGRVLIPNCGIAPPERSADGLTVAGTVETGLGFPDGDEQARIWRDDLRGHEKEQDVVAVTWDGLYDISGFYRVTNVEFETKKYYSNYNFSVELAYAVEGTPAGNDVYFVHRWTGRPPNGAVVNDFSITTAAEPAIAVPVGASGFDPGTSLPSSMTRSLSSGYLIRVYRDVAIDSSGHGQARWSVDPASALIGAARIRRN